MSRPTIHQLFRKAVKNYRPVPVGRWYGCKSRTTINRIVRGENLPSFEGFVRLSRELAKRGDYSLRDYCDSPRLTTHVMTNGSLLDERGELQLAAADAQRAFDGKEDKTWARCRRWLESIVLRMDAEFDQQDKRIESNAVGAKA